MENNNVKNITNEELISIYKTLFEFVKDLEKDIEKLKEEEYHEWTAAKRNRSNQE